jgi:hypothetical protein
MFIWQHIELPEDEVSEIRNRTLPDIDKLTNNIHFYQGLDLGITKFMGLDVYEIVLIQSLGRAVGNIHTDYRAFNNNNKLAINFSLRNCENSVTEFWESTHYDPANIQYTSSNRPYIGLTRDNCRKITEFTLVKPVLFNTDVPHSVRNYSVMPRLAISVRLQEDPWHLVS